MQVKCNMQKTAQLWQNKYCSTENPQVLQTNTKTITQEKQTKCIKVWTVYLAEKLQMKLFKQNTAKSLETILQLAGFCLNGSGFIYYFMDWAIDEHTKHCLTW